MAEQVPLFGELPAPRRRRLAEVLELRGLAVQDVELVVDRVAALRRLVDRGRRRALRYRRHRDRLIYRKCRRRWTSRVRDAEKYARQLEAQLEELERRLRGWA